MSCQQSQQLCQPPPKCPPSPKCPLKSPTRCLPPAPASCAPGSGDSCGPSSEGGCCLSHHMHHSSNSCDRGSGLQAWDSGCGHGSGGSC